MASYIFIVPPFMGHLTATLSVGNGLLQKGHTVRWISSRPLPERLIPKNGTWLIPDELKNSEDALNEIQHKAERIKTTSSLQSIKVFYDDIILPLNRYLMPGVDKILNVQKPDIVINDLVAFAGAICAYKRNIPFATSITVPTNVLSSTGSAKAGQWEIDRLIEFQKEYGILNEETIFTGEVNLLHCPVDFLHPSDLPKHCYFVGPAITNRPSEVDFEWGALSNSVYPKILVSLGTLLKEDRMTFFTKIVEAFKDKKYTIVAVAEKNLLPWWPDNFIVQPIIPQLELLPLMDAVISHGGANTVCEALANDLPLLVIPMGYDQYYNSSQVELAGCGIRLKGKRLTIHDLQNSLQELLTNDQYKKAAIITGAKFRAGGGTQRAVEILEEFAKKRTLVDF